MQAQPAAPRNPVGRLSLLLVYQSHPSSPSDLPATLCPTAQVVDMELPDAGGRGVLGAALAGSRAGACRLLVLAREGLRVIDM